MQEDPEEGIPSQCSKSCYSPRAHPPSSKGTLRGSPTLHEPHQDGMVREQLQSCLAKTEMCLKVVLEIPFPSRTHSCCEQTLTQLVLLASQHWLIEEKLLKVKCKLRCFLKSWLRQQTAAAVLPEATLGRLIM